MKITKLQCTLCDTKFAVIPLSKEDMRLARCAAAGGHRLCPRCLEYNSAALQEVVARRADACVLRQLPKRKTKTERRKRAEAPQ